MTRSSVNPDVVVERGDEDEIDTLNAPNLPAFMRWESPGNWAWGEIYDRYPELQVVIREGARAIGAMNLIPARRGARTPDLAGFDDVVTSAVDTPGTDTDCLCLLSISLAPDVRGRGLAEALIRHSKELAAQRSYRSVIGPLRPTRKHNYPLIPIEAYAAWRRTDGTPFDPWLRLHHKFGAQVVGVAPRSLVIDQPIDRWEDESQLPMPGDGDYLVPGALAPILVAHGRGIYAEPNIWISHQVTEEPVE